jgi:hypothetical protein
MDVNVSLANNKYMKTQKVVAALSDVDLFNNLLYTRMDGWELVKDTMRQEKTAVGVTIHVCIVEKEIDTEIPQIGPTIPEKDWDKQMSNPTSSPTVKLPTPNKKKETVRISLPPKPGRKSESGYNGHGKGCNCFICNH